MIQGLSVRTLIERQHVHALVPREVLEQCFGAGEHPDSWMRAFVDYEGVIKAAVSAAFRRTPTAIVLVRSEDIEAVTSRRASAM